MRALLRNVPAYAFTAPGGASSPQLLDFEGFDIASAMSCEA